MADKSIDDVKAMSFEVALAELPATLDSHRLVLLATAGVDLPRHGGQGPRRAVLRLTALTEAAP